MSGTDRIATLSAQFAAAMPDLDAASQRAAVTLLRLLAQGEPVDSRRLSNALALPTAYLDETLEGLPGVFRDDQRRIIAFMGLSVVEVSDHRIHIDGRSLSARCAWDALFLPELLGETARVSLRCPSTGEVISVTVTPTGITDLEPPGTRMSLLVPKGQFGADVLQSSCHFVHFFTSPDAAASWTAGHRGTFALTVADGYRLSQFTNRATFGAALDASSTA